MLFKYLRISQIPWCFTNNSTVVTKPVPFNANPFKFDETCLMPQHRVYLMHIPSKLQKCTSKSTFKSTSESTLLLNYSVNVIWVHLIKNVIQFKSSKYEFCSFFCSLVLSIIERYMFKSFHSFHGFIYFFQFWKFVSHVL